MSSALRTRIEERKDGGEDPSKGMDESQKQLSEGQRGWSTACFAEV